MSCNSRPMSTCPKTKTYEDKRREMALLGIILTMSPCSVTGVRCPPDNFLNFTPCVAGVPSWWQSSLASSGAVMAPAIVFFGPPPAASWATRSAHANRNPWLMGSSLNWATILLPQLQRYHPAGNDKSSQSLSGGGWRTQDPQRWALGLANVSHAVGMY